MCLAQSRAAVLLGWGLKGDQAACLRLRQPLLFMPQTPATLLAVLPKLELLPAQQVKQQSSWPVPSHAHLYFNQLLTWSPTGWSTSPAARSQGGKEKHPNRAGRDTQLTYLCSFGSLDWLFTALHGGLRICWFTAPRKSDLFLNLKCMLWQVI